MERFPVRRVVLAADRSMLGRGKIDELQEAVDDECRKSEFILSAPSRRCKDPPKLSGAACSRARRTRKGKISRRLHSEDAGRSSPGPRPSAQANRRPELPRRQKRDKRPIFWLPGPRQTPIAAAPRATIRSPSSPARSAMPVSGNSSDSDSARAMAAPSGPREAEVEKAELSDGRLAPETNVEGIEPADVVARHMSLALFESGYRVSKSDIEIAPVCRLWNDSIRAHALIRVFALVPFRAVGARLKADGILESDSFPSRQPPLDWAPSGRSRELGRLLRSGARLIEAVWRSLPGNCSARIKRFRRRREPENRTAETFAARIRPSDLAIAMRRATASRCRALRAGCPGAGWRYWTRT